MTHTQPNRLERTPPETAEEPAGCGSAVPPVRSIAGVQNHGTGAFVDAAGPTEPTGTAHADDRAARRARAHRRRTNERAIRRRREAGPDSEAGMATAEYAIATLAAVGFAALLVAVLSSGEVKGLLMSLITSALNFG
ncbi:DUF4244 domain-containing protein [uncultured Arthrobacter sp.]|uniref:DUF4244 domain-containing protein n=1 Tax=uncultured Arthrobacter sp. TaxID=114050 RepID=UPI002638A0BB|nr:DUF4244 domain-containing protein [uncultured Arthrobacter sp.]